MESDTKGENLIGANVVAEDVTLTSFFGFSIFYFLAATTSVLSVIFIFKCYRGEFKGGVWKSIHFDSHHSASSSASGEVINYSTAIDLKNGFVQVNQKHYVYIFFKLL